MESDSWSRLFGKRHQPRFGDAFLGFEEAETTGEEESKTEYFCPFCSDNFDVVGLCFHIDDEHPVEAKNGICPVCMEQVGIDLVGHLTKQHKSFFKMQLKKRKSHRGSLSKKDSNNNNNHNYYDNNKQPFFNGSGFLNSAAPDPLLSSFISNLSVKSEPSNEKEAVSAFDAKAVKRVEPSIPTEEQEERSRQSQFARGLLLSTIFDEHDFL